MVNRLLRRHGFEDYTAFTAPETLLALDLVNQAIRDLTAQRDYPWNIRSDGVVQIRAEQTGTATCSITGTTIGITSFPTSTVTDVTGSTFVAKLIATDATNHPNTPLRILNGTITAGTYSGTLAQQHPDTPITNSDWRMYFNVYLLPDTVAKVLSARYHERSIRVVELGPHATWDEYFPNDYEVTGSPEVIGVGGMASSTPQTGTDATEGLRLSVWPVPTIKTRLMYTYKERIAELTATTSTLVAPSEFVDDVVDRAEALSNMTQRFNAPELAQQQLRNGMMTAERKWVNSVLDPNRRHSLRAHDSGVRRRDPTKYRDITGL